MIIKCKILLSFFVLICSFLVSSAQNQQDFQVWTNFSIEKDLKDFKFFIEEEFRFHQNASAIEYFFTDFGLDYEISKKIDLGVNYRLKFNHVYIEQYENSHRFNLDIKYNFDFKRFDCYYRLRYQTEVESFRYIPTGEFFKNKLRNKLKIKYDINNSKLEPSFSVETFTDLTNWNYAEFSKIRFTFGLGSEKNKFKGFSTFFRYEQTFSNNINKSDFIVGISYTLDL